MFAIQITDGNRDANRYPKIKEVMPLLFGGWGTRESGTRFPRFYELDSEAYMEYPTKLSAQKDLDFLLSKGWVGDIILSPQN
jgi:hypothetical protein